MSDSTGLAKDFLIAVISKKGLTSKGITKITNTFENKLESAMTNAVGTAYENQYKEKNIQED